MSKQETIPDPLQYEVQISKIRTKFFFTPKFTYEVYVRKDKKLVSELFHYGYCYSLKSAKKKAVKHIIGVEKELDKGLNFGLIIEVSGTVNQIKDQLSE